MMFHYSQHNSTCNNCVSQTLSEQTHLQTLFYSATLCSVFLGFKALTNTNDHANVTMVFFFYFPFALLERSSAAI